MPRLAVRWSETEAHKPYARPFMVSFIDDQDTTLGSVAVNGADLLYYRQFQAAVMALAGELFRDEQVERDRDPQRAWLDQIAALVPPATALRVTPHSTFDHQVGRRFGFAISAGDGASADVEPNTLLEYQECQAAVAHQTGRLFRVAELETIADAQARQSAWLAWLRDRLSPPDAAEALTAAWPWR